MISRVAKTIYLLNKTEKKAYAIMSISFFVISIMGILALRPSVKIVTQYKKRLIEAKKIDKQLSTKIEALYDNANIVKQNYDKVQKINEAIPKNMSQDDILKRVFQIALSADMQLIKTDFNKLDEKEKNPATEKGIKKIMLIIDAVGKQDNIYKFIGNIENESRYINVKSFIIQKAEEETSVSINAEIYYSE